MATTRTWVDGGNNEASYPNDWSPAGVPQPGDSLILSAPATINISGDALTGDRLNIPATPFDDSHIQINTRAGATLDLAGFTHHPIDVHVDGILNLNTQLTGIFGSHLTFSGGTISFIGGSRRAD